MGSGQTAHIDDITYSRFANIDPDHSSVKMKDEPLVFAANMGISIGKGVVSGLQEALGNLEWSAAAAAVSTAVGISLSAVASPGAAFVVSILYIIAGVIGTIQSLFMIAQSAGGIYSTATGTGTIYDKAEAFAHDFIIMVVGIVFLAGSVKAIQSSLSTFQSAAQELFGRKSRLTPSEVTQTFQGTKLITSFEEFTEYTKGYLDDDALQYVKEVLNKDADDIAKLKKIAQLVEDGSKKIGKKLSKEELKAGLDAFWDDAGVEGVLAAIEKCWQQGGKFVSEADRLKIDAWRYTPDDGLYLKYKDVFDNPKYYNQKTGEIHWPKNNGFKGTPQNEILKPGTKIDRYGGNTGKYTSPVDTPYEMRAVAPGTEQQPYSIYEVVEPIEVKSGEIAPWFGEPGGGIQYLLPETLKDLLESGMIRRIN